MAVNTCKGEYIVIVHVVHAHSESDSFVKAMHDVITEQLMCDGATVTSSDLYAMGFNPLMSEHDFMQRQQKDHLVYALEQRKGFESGTLSPDIQSEVEKVLGADLLVFTFPVYWFSVPAILKGWIERVFLSGSFYGGKRIYGKGGLQGKRAFVATCLGGRAHMFGPHAIHGELTTGMMRHFFQGCLGYVGLSVHEPFVAYHVPYIGDDERAVLLQDLRKAVQTLDQRPILPMPDLDKYDDGFEPKVLG